MRKERLDTTEPFVTKDGSEIRELAGTPTGNSVNQSLAEATVPPGADTEEHFHRVVRGDLPLHERQRPDEAGRRAGRGRRPATRS